MIGQPIADLEKATEIPSGSSYVAAMGDGSGTKLVQQEVLTKEVGKALKIGNLEELQTEAKGSIVAAINEAAQSGGGGSDVDILDTKEEIEANTESGKAAGAQAVKEMFGEINDNLQGFTPVIDESTGKMTGYKTTIGGADAVFPFKSDIMIPPMVFWGDSNIRLGCAGYNALTLNEYNKGSVSVSGSKSTNYEQNSSPTDWVTLGTLSNQTKQFDISGYNQIKIACTKEAAAVCGKITY